MKVPEQVVPQVIPPVAVVTVPCPIFETVTVNVFGVGFGVGIVALFAEQLACDPPLVLLHVHVYGPLPDTDDAVPSWQSACVGVYVND